MSHNITITDSSSIDSTSDCGSWSDPKAVGLMISVILNAGFALGGIWACKSSRTSKSHKIEASSKIFRNTDGVIIREHKVVKASITAAKEKTNNSGAFKVGAYERTKTKLHGKSTTFSASSLDERDDTEEATADTGALSLMPNLRAVAARVAVEEAIKYVDGGNQEGNEAVISLTEATTNPAGYAAREIARRSIATVMGHLRGRAATDRESEDEVGHDDEVKESHHHVGRGARFHHVAKKAIEKARAGVMPAAKEDDDEDSEDTDLGEPLWDAPDSSAASGKTDKVDGSATGASKDPGSSPVVSGTLQDAKAEGRTGGTEEKKLSEGADAQVSVPVASESEHSAHEEEAAPGIHRDGEEASSAASVEHRRAEAIEGIHEDGEHDSGEAEVEVVEHQVEVTVSLVGDAETPDGVYA